MISINKIISILKKECKKYRNPIVTEISFSKDPFKVLISCLLSLRTKDEVTTIASRRLFDKAEDIKKLSKLNDNEIEKLIYPVGFYKVKAKRIKEICNKLTKEYNSKVPNNLDELLNLKGVGRKTANLVLSLGYKKPAICVDVHVHRISNRLGYVKTKDPYETETELRKKLPKKYWIFFNDLLVCFGQNICRPISPWCSKCAIRKYCKMVGVKKSR